MKVIDKILTRHVAPFFEVVAGVDHKTAMSNNILVLKGAIAGGIIEGLTEEEIDNSEPWRMADGGDLQEIALKVSGMVTNSLKPPDPKY